MPAQNKSPQSINLLPGQKLDDSAGGKILKWLLSTFRIIVILVQVVVIGGFAARVFIDARLSNINQEIEDKYALARSYQDTESKFKTAQLKLDTYTSLQSEGNKYLSLVTAISQQIPNTVQLISIQKNESRLIVKARTTQESSMYSFTQRMDEIEGVDNPQVVEIAQDPNSTSISEFIIHATVPSGA